MSSPPPPGSDAFSDPQGQQPSEEEMRAYVEQLRTSDPAGILVQAYQVLGTGAEVKLGRADARLLIDAMNALTSAVGDRIDQQLVEQMQAGVVQMQNAQVQAEAELRQQESAGQPESGAGAGGQAGGRAGGEGSPQAPGGHGKEAPAGGQDAGTAGAPGSPSTPNQGAGGQQMTDRLWIPGRDPGTPSP